MGVIRLFVCEFVGNAQVEAKLRACAQASSHGLSLQYMNLTADRGQSAMAELKL
jgi:hypothetical protein